MTSIMCCNIDLEHGFHFLFSYQEFSHHWVTFKRLFLEINTKYSPMVPANKTLIIVNVPTCISLLVYLDNTYCIYLKHHEFVPQRSIFFRLIDQFKICMSLCHCPMYVINRDLFQQYVEIKWISRCGIFLNLVIIRFFFFQYTNKII